MDASRRVAAWWENKPPSHRGIVLAGLSVSALLLILALILDATIGRDGDTMFPSLTGFVWDLVKIVTAGTLGFAVVSDFRDWGSAWRTMKVEEPALRAVVHDFVCTVWSIFGLDANHLMEGRDLQGSRREVDECGSFFMRLFRRRDAQIETRLRQSGLTMQRASGEGNSEPAAAIMSWGDLLTCLSTFPLTEIDRSRVSSPFDPSLLSAKVGALSACIQRTVADPGVSTHLKTDAAKVLVALDRVEAEALLLHSWIGELARGEDGLPEPDPRSDTGPVGSLIDRGSMVPPPPVVVFTMLGGFLGRMDAELALGSPSARQYGAG